MEQASSLQITPIQQSDRIQSLDVMRGIVLCGILLMNINSFGLANSYNDPTVAGGFTGWNLYTWITTNMFFEGTMRGLFSLLFGVGMFIFLDRLTKRGAGIKAADIFFRRLIWLLVFGLIHGYLLLWTGEILYDYALMGFLVYSFRNMAPKKLIVAASVLVLGGMIWNYSDFRASEKLVADVSLIDSYKAENKELTKELEESQTKWEKFQEERSPEFIAEFNSSMQKGYFDVVSFLAPINLHFDTWMSYRYGLWDVLSMMLVGIALFKLNILSGDKSLGFYGKMAAIGYLIGISINYYELQVVLNGQFSPVAIAKSNLTYDLGRIATSMGHIGLIMLFSKSNFLIWLKSSLASVGKMALTNYIMHSVICMIVFTGVGFGLFGKLQRYELLYVVFPIWIFQLILSPIWLRYFHYGPLEWLWRNLSYRKVHSFRKESPQPILSNGNLDPLNTSN
ncbi:DUF418 domain-containing protein [Algoriphagus sp.]|jgi:uncharacterized protein|uniref:DUF418 domain-containing protein n=2 Tax=Algoriphagus sp. TaxID=1872435 RepID=UPI00272250F2|nr:DUF418 domain-containing protein [Algoriphagus sp.]MDO8966585.1 DUF418 domain-containing protein [Algoriphagus sp.]MDP3202031.1 DUF418 domain-containing protein [Algoriphagus sp.]